MTTPIIPDSIIQLFANEIYKINLKVADAICKKYNLDPNEVKETLKDELQVSLDIIPSEQLNVKVVQKRSYGTKTPPELRCEGRVYHKDKNEYSQCIRKKSNDCCYCYYHSENLPFGNINDKEPPLKEVKKRGVY
jgi:hypothetical protein